MSFTTYAPEEQKTTRGTREVRESQRSRRTRGEDLVPAPGHRSDHLPGDFRKINGWGADLDPAVRPSYPREYPSEVKTPRGEVKHWQKPTTKILVTNEQPGITPVFGTSCPLHGLSGRLREFAYQYGEGTNRRWMTLMFADRVDVMEHLIMDALRGKPDRYIKEKAWGTKLKYSSPQQRRQWMAVGGIVLAAVAIGILATRE